jgi:predicted acylesterase/phospholipase RssA
MKVLNLSGAATKIGGLYGVCEKLMLDNGWKPDVITGVSSGALLSVPLALGKFDEVRKLVLEFSLDHIFDKKPVNESGKITSMAIMRVLAGKLGLGSQGNLVKTLAKVVRPVDFLRYQSSSELPVCYIMAIDYVTGHKKVWNLKTVSYMEYLNAVKASCSIPGYVEPVEMDGMVLFDGGVRDHIMSRWLLEKEGTIKEVISVYSRPEEYVPTTGFKVNGISAVIKRTLDLITHELSANDEQAEKDWCSENGIKRKGYYLPRVLGSQYDTDPARLKMLYEIGRGLVEGSENVG